MLSDNDLLHRGIENQLSPVYSSIHFLFFFLSTFYVKDISLAIYDRSSYKVYRITKENVFRRIDICYVN